MAKKNPDSPAQAGLVTLVLLLDCSAGHCGQVLELPAAEASVLIADGAADPHPDAIAAAKTRC